LTCKQVILDYLLDYLDATLNPDVVASLERHLETCRPCVAYLNTYKRTRDLTGRMVPMAMPDEMKTHLRRFLLEQLAKNESPG
jgi:anti-sigma factor RsiW